MTLRELKQQIEWMEEHGYDLDTTEVRLYDREGEDFYKPTEAVEDDSFTPKTLELHYDGTSPMEIAP